MEEKNTAVEVTEVVENTAAEEKKSAGSFKCISAPLDKRIVGISLLTAIIVVVIYHFVMLAVNTFCKEEQQFVSCYCHQNSGEEEKEDKPKEFRRKRMGRDGKRGEFPSRQMSPEMREKIRNMSPEERKAFFAKLREKRGEKGPRGPRPPRGPRGQRPARDAQE